MGASQSSGRDSDPQNVEAVRKCYYEVLGVERQASDDEIKKAYRKKALELHPDRNYGDVENATAKFAEVQSAYEILSDPQERAWYDSHRDSILRGSSGPADDHFEHNVRLTSSMEIVSLIGRFNSRVPFTDAPGGFYGTLRETFTRLAREEIEACDLEGLDSLAYPDFGMAEDDYEEIVRPFYKVWANFTTKKTFSWREAYRSADAPDRATRRLVDKENKRLREEGIRDFNDAVRSLVAFVRKRDPRFVPNSQSEADRQKTLRDAAAAQAARSRAANQAKLKEHIIPAWAQTQQLEDNGEFAESEESEVEHIECVVCGKTFKSEKQYEAHEKSKKHVKAVQQLHREMRKENEQLHLDPPSDGESGIPIYGLESLDHNQDQTEKESTPDSSKPDQNGATEDSYDDDQKMASEKIPQTSPKVLSETPSDPSDVDDEYTSREQVEDRLVGSLPHKDTQEELNDSTTAFTSDRDEIPRLGKAKLKRAKKKAKQEKEIQESQEFRCAACNETFTSKTKLFGHIKEFDHAIPVPGATRGKNKRN